MADDLIDVPLAALIFGASLCIAVFLVLAALPFLRTHWLHSLRTPGSPPGWVKPRSTAAWVRYGLLAWYLMNVPSASIWILSYVVPVPLPLLIFPTFFLLPGTLVVASLVQALWGIPFSPWYYALFHPISGSLLNLPIYASLATLFGWGVAWGEPRAASPREDLAAEQGIGADERRHA